MKRLRERAPDGHAVLGLGWMIRRPSARATLGGLCDAVRPLDVAAMGSISIAVRVGGRDFGVESRWIASHVRERRGSLASRERLSDGVWPEPIPQGLKVTPTTDRSERKGKAPRVAQAANRIGAMASGILVGCPQHRDLPSLVLCCTSKLF